MCVCVWVCVCVLGVVRSQIPPGEPYRRTSSPLPLQLTSAPGLLRPWHPTLGRAGLGAFEGEPGAGGILRVEGDLAPSWRPLSLPIYPPDRSIFSCVLQDLSEQEM